MIKLTASIALCMIVKDEAHNLTDCLASVRDLVDEIWIVDTGSRDGTPELAKQLGAQVITHPWNGDFAAARNTGLAQVAADWILVLDADERLEPGGAEIIKGFVQSEQAAEIGACIVRVVNYLGGQISANQEDSYNIRLFRNRPDHRYEGAIHEQIGSVIKRVSPHLHLASLPISILHHGYSASDPRAKTKSQRNLELIERELERYPDDLYLHYHAGVCLINMGRLDEAITHLARTVVEGESTLNYVPRALKVWVMALQRKREYRQALALLDQWQPVWPRYTDLEYLRAELYRDLRDYSRALVSLQRCLEMGPSPPPYDSNRGTSGHDALLMMGDIAFILGDYSLAEKAYCRVPVDLPIFLRAAVWLLGLYEQRHSREQALKRLGQLLPVKRRRSLLAEICEAAGWYTEALQIAQSDPWGGANRQALVGRCLYRLGRIEESWVVLAEIPTDHPQWGTAQLWRIYCAVTLCDPTRLDTVLEPLLAALPSAAGVAALARCLLGLPYEQAMLQQIDRSMMIGFLQAVAPHVGTERLDVFQNQVLMAGLCRRDLSALLLFHCHQPQLAWECYQQGGAEDQDQRLEIEILIGCGQVKPALELYLTLLKREDCLPEDYLRVSRLCRELSAELGSIKGGKRCEAKPVYDRTQRSG